MKLEYDNPKDWLNLILFILIVICMVLLFLPWMAFEFLRKSYEWMLDTEEDSWEPPQ